MPQGRPGQAAAGPEQWGEIPGPAAADPPPPDPSRPRMVVARGVWASDLGGPEGERWIHDVTTGEVTDKTGKVVRTLAVPDQPWRPGAGDSVMPAKTAPAEIAAPPEPGGTGPPPAPAPDRPLPSDGRQWTDAERAEHRRRESEAAAQWRHWQLFQRIHQQG